MLRGLSTIVYTAEDVAAAADWYAEALGATPYFRRPEEGPAAYVEFRLGEIEHLPVADGEVDVIISNCVINLSPDKRAVLSEAYRALRPGGRLAISDIVATAPLPESVRQDPALWSACISGATSINELAALLDDAGFMSIRIAPKDESRDLIREWAPGSRAEEYIVSAMIEAVKPAT